MYDYHLEIINTQLIDNSVFMSEYISPVSKA